MTAVPPFQLSESHVPEPSVPRTVHEQGAPR